MCYSAQIKSDYLRFVRQWGADLSLREFVDVFWRRTTDTKVKIPKAMQALFASPRSDDERRIAELVDEFATAEKTRLEQELFLQRKRLADAERTLQSKTTKAATENKRIASDKIAWAMDKLADLRRTEPDDEDSRIFPGWYA